MNIDRRQFLGAAAAAATIGPWRAAWGWTTAASVKIERIELFEPDYPGLAELRQKLGT